MPSTTPADLRNVALVGHSASGKTTLSEAILFTAKSITRMGTITDGNTVSDYHPDEIQREVSISSTLMHFEWGERRINLIDTPGYTDFTGEAKSGLSAVDNAVVVLNGQNGMEVGTEIVWSYAEEFNLPRALVVNGLQREHADFDGVLEQVRERLGNGAVAVQLPANPGEGFNAVIDLINMQQTTYESAGDGRGTSGAIDESYQDEADTLREQLVEAVAELNEELLEKYLEDGDLDQDTLVTGLRNAVAKGDIFPILCADAAANIGTSQ
ncbi:MAG: GTP-binding protein, partial [Candidatus Latescibacteria bacterium]|nr:GTP-binding protein [Candidatus Latescibacterota bacterium]